MKYRYYILYRNLTLYGTNYKCVSSLHRNSILMNYIKIELSQLFKKHLKIFIIIELIIHKEKFLIFVNVMISILTML